MANYNNTSAPSSNFKPMVWDSVAIPVNSLSGGTISATPIKYDYNLPGELLDYTMMYDIDWILASGMSEDDLHNYLKKELAVKLAEKMLEDEHFSFTKQTDPAARSVRFKAYTWVGNKAFIEQQRKNKR
jgi:hypothetical protein